MQRGHVLERDESGLHIQEEHMTRHASERVAHHRFWHQGHRLSLFEKVIVANSVMLVGEALVGLWVTSHSLESHHYLIDTSFLIIAALCSLLINIVVLRASFRPLFRLLLTIRAVSTGQTTLRTPVPADPDIGELTHAFNEMLDQLEASQREQTLHIVQAQEEERRRLARELHDETSQALTALLIHTEVLSQHMAASAPRLPLREQQQLEEDITMLAHLTQETLNDIRVLAQQVRPSVLDDLGLQAALRWLAEDGRERLHLNTKVEVVGTASALPLSSVYETTLFRIAQESLTNSARYADATTVNVVLTLHQHQVTLTVTDDGCGFDPSHVQHGLGLRGMRERAALLKGTLRLRSSLGQGTIVEVVLPLSEAVKTTNEEESL